MWSLHILLLHTEVQVILSMRLFHQVPRKNLLLMVIPLVEEGGTYWLEEFKEVQFSHLVVSDSLQPHRLQHARLPCPSTTPGAYSHSCPWIPWCHPTISSSVIPFPSCLRSSPASGFFPMSQFFASGGQSIGVSASASVLPKNILDWFPLGWTGWISLLFKGLSRLFSNSRKRWQQNNGKTGCSNPLKMETRKKIAPKFPVNLLSLFSVRWAAS